MQQSAPPNPLEPSSLHAPSYYAATLTEHVSDTLPLQDSTTQVCVIGAGFTGLSAALRLAQRGIDVTVLEQSRLAWGASGRNGGQAHVGLRREQGWLEQKIGVGDARKLWDLAIDARDHLDTTIRNYSIRCDWRSGLLQANHKDRFSTDTRRYVDHLRDQYGYSDIRFVDKAEIRELIATDQYFSGSLDSRSGHLHPMNYALGIARAAVSHGARLHESAEVIRVQRSGTDWMVHTSAARIRADKVILACNGYLRGISARVEAHVMPINNFIAVTEPLGAERAQSIIRSGYAVADSRFVVNYYRFTADHRLLFGGGENYGYRFPADIIRFVRPHLLKVFPQLASVRFDFGWGGTLAITANRMPYIRELEPGFYNVSGFSGLGVVLAPYCGKIVADAIAEDRGAFDAFARIPIPRFPGGPALRRPTLVAAMLFYALRDRL